MGCVEAIHLSRLENTAILSKLFGFAEKIVHWHYCLAAPVTAIVRLDLLFL